MGVKIVANLYANENLPVPVVNELRELGHDVLTSYEAGNANKAIPDDQVLSFAAQLQRAVITLNRYDFIALHNCNSNHAGIVVCKEDVDFSSLAKRIDVQIRANNPLTGKLVRINRR